MSKRRQRSLWYLAIVGLVAVALAGLLVLLHPVGRPLTLALRVAAVLGYTSVFLAVISSVYMRQLVRFFGRPFVQIHHVLTLTGLGLITLHPIGAAIDAGSPAVWLPRFDSFYVFFSLGGRPAWYLIALAALVAWQRRAIGDRWRIIHYLNYLAFLLATVHANLIGANFNQYVVARVFSILMALAVTAAFVQKRVSAGKRSKGPAKSTA